MSCRYPSLWPSWRHGSTFTHPSLYAVRICTQDLRTLPSVQRDGGMKMETATGRRARTRIRRSAVPLCGSVRRGERERERERERL